MERKRPNHGYCEVCQGPINYPQMWTLTGNMSRIHENQDHCIRSLHLRHGMVVNTETGKRIRIPKKEQSNFEKLEKQSYDRDVLLRRKL